MDTVESTNRNNGSKSKDQEHQEGPVARAIEEQTARIPSDVFLWTAGAAILGSMAFQLIGTERRGPLRYLFGRRRAAPATFVGMWVPTILLLGIYNKIVKVAGSDKTSR